ncbi:MAG TPA: hypothetical protein VKA86_08165 [Candidatus Krumholzibacteria bacterium]|nr:hypothetical protein [Candidatus Krumholzibacteria bacterium]
MNHHDHDPELLASLALDDEIDHDELLRLLDAMADDADARRSWREARATQAMIARAGASVPTDRSARPQPASRRRPAPRRSRRRLAAAAVGVAAMIVVGLGLARMLPADRGPVTTTTAYDVRLGENAGAMSDERFVDLAVELLRADERYRDEMFALLDEVRATAIVPESRAHERRPARETRIARSASDDDFDRSRESTASLPAAF